MIDGFRRGLKEAGLVEGQDFTTTYRNAQGDIATLNAMFDELNGDDTDLVVSFSTPALQAALRKIDRKPIVFAGVLDPIAAGAGKSDTDHRPNVTGVYLDFPYAPMAQHDPRGLSEGSPGRHPLHARRDQLRRRPATVRGGAQGCGARAGEPAGQRSVRSERRGPHPLPVGGRRLLPDLGQPEQRLVPGDRPGVRDGEDAALHVLAVAW